MRTVSGIFSQQPASAPPQEYSIWSSSAFGSVDQFDELAQGIIIGTKFRSTSAGYIVGIRWQRNSAHAGAASVALFQGSTNVSGTKTVSGQTASGWQRMDFDSPVAISATTIYTAAAHFGVARAGYYATSNLFASAVNNAPLEAVANSVSVNGVYNYGSSMAAPTSTFNSSCYFIDLFFIY